MKSILRLLALLALANVARAAEMAAYDISLSAVSPPRITVRATIPMAGDALQMSRTRPGDVSPLDKGGWPAFVRDLHVTDDSGVVVPVEARGIDGWRVKTPHRRLRLTYEIDYSTLAQLGWPAQREAAFADADHVVVVGRSLFITPKAVNAPIRVRMRAPKGWSVATAWIGDSSGRFSPASIGDLTENLIAFSRRRVATVTASGFSVSLVPTGWWQPAGADVRLVVASVLPRLVQLIGSHRRAQYLVVLLPAQENGGESFRSSFALTTEQAPTLANRSAWGNTIAHEIFHYWNGWRLRGTDYAASQWFQEGFTEYAANLATVASGIIGPAEFRAKLAEHISKSGRLTTTLEAPGNHKGPPLYSSGALVAFTWDVLIRRATSGRRSIADLYQTLWRNTEEGRQTYDWTRIRDALRAVTTEVDWDDYYQRHIRGHEPLPMAEVLPLVGLRVTSDASGPQLHVDDTAPPAAHARWRALVSMKRNAR